MNFSNPDTRSRPRVAALALIVALTACSAPPNTGPGPRADPWLQQFFLDFARCG